MLKRYERELKIRCSHKDFDLWVQQALDADMSLSDWVRRQLRSSGPVQTQAMRSESVVPTSVPTPRVVATVGSPSASASMPDYQDSVLEIVFEKPATWKLVTEGGLRTSTSKRPDPSSKKWAKQDLMTFCVENEVVGFQRAWDAMESEMSDGGFAG